MTARYIIGDVRAVLATLEPASVDLVLTSPPFLALRSYLPADHPDKPLEIGSEPTPGAYIDTLLDVVEACSRVLAPHGSMCFELGDTYSGSGGAGGDYNDNGLRDGQNKFNGSASKRCSTVNDRTAEESRLGVDARNRARRGGNASLSRSSDDWPLDRSLCLIPETFRFALVYGFNPLTGRQTPRWRARNVVSWCRPNPSVGALGDKYRPATTTMVVVCKDRRYFDLDAVRQPLADSPGNRYVRKVSARDASVEGSSATNNVITADYDPTASGGAPPLDWWKIPTQPYEGAHHATWPQQLCVIPIASMCPQRVCVTCGKPSERIVETERTNEKDDSTRIVKAGEYRLNGHDHPPEVGWEIEHRTVGWTDCGHNNWRTGLVLDPFAGSGTTLQVATGHGRHAIGIDLDPRNAQLAVDRVGPLLLSVEHHEQAVA